MKIIIYSTPGCFACKVMSKIIKSEDIANNSKISKIIEEIVDFDKDGKIKAKSLGLKDFPTIRFINDISNEVEGELIGTYPINAVLNKITELRN